MKITTDKILAHDWKKAYKIQDTTNIFVKKQQLNIFLKRRFIKVLRKGGTTEIELENKHTALPNL